MMVSETTCSQISSGRHSRQTPCGARFELSNRDCTALSMDPPQVITLRSTETPTPHHGRIDTMDFRVQSAAPGYGVRVAASPARIRWVFSVPMTSCA